MNITLIKSLQRSSRIAVSLMLTALVAVGCAEDSADRTFDSTGTGLRLESLDLDILGGMAGVDVVIDNEARTVDIFGLTQGDLIVGVDFAANLEGASFVPSLASRIGRWEKSFSAILATAEVSESYTFSLPDYVRGDSNTIYIDIDNTDIWKQEVGFIGVDMERSGDNLIQWPNAQEGARWAFGDCKPEYLRLSYDKKQELVEGVYNWAFYDNVIAALDLIHAVNPNVKLWCTLKSDYGGYNDENNFPDWFSTYKLTDPNGKTSVELDEYAGFLARYLNYFNSKGHPIMVVSTAKEYMEAIDYADDAELIPMILDSLATNYPNVPTPIFNGPSSWSMGGSAGYVNRAVAGDGVGTFWGFCSHNYNSSSDGGVATFVDAVRKSDGMGNCFGEDCYAIHSEYNGAVIGATYGVEPTTLQSSRYAGKASDYSVGLQGELMFEYWNDGLSGTRALHCKRDGTDGYRMTNYYMLKSHINYFREKMHYLEAKQINMRSGVSSMQFADWGTNEEKSTRTYGGVKEYRLMEEFNQTIGPIYTKNLDGQLYVCVTNDSGSAISSVLIDLGNKRYNGTYEMHVMDNETTIVDGNKAGYYQYGELENGTIDFAMPETSVVYFLIDLVESDVDDDDDDDDDDSGYVTNDTVVLEQLTDDGNAWEVK